MRYQCFLFILILSCSKVEVQKETCLPKLKEIRTTFFESVPDRELASTDNDLRLSNLEYGKKYFKEIKGLNEGDSTCVERPYDQFSFSKAVLNELKRYDSKTQKEIIKDLKDYISYTVDHKDSTVLNNLLMFALLRKASRQGYFLNSKNRLVNQTRETEEQFNKIKDIKNAKDAKLKEEILYQTSRNNILEIMDRG